MTKHTYFRASDGTIFLPEPTVGEIRYCRDNAQAYKQCVDYETAGTL
jgi:hypothetical protein